MVPQISAWAVRSIEQWCGRVGETLIEQHRAWRARRSPCAYEFTAVVAAPATTSVIWSTLIGAVFAVAQTLALLRAMLSAVDPRRSRPSRGSIQLQVDRQRIGASHLTRQVQTERFVIVFIMIFPIRGAGCGARPITL
jgi:hypothetical protein